MPVAVLESLIREHRLGTLLTRAVLVVDDEPENLAVLEDALSDDYTVFKAGSVDEALAIAARTPLDVVLTDQRMPGRTGVELLTRLRDTHADVAGIIVSAYTDTSTVLAAINEARVFRFLNKPWSLDVLLTTLAQASEHVYLTRAVRRLVDLLAERNVTLTRTITDLQSAHQRLAQADRLATLGQLAAGVTHDLRNALMGLVMVGDELTTAPIPAEVRESFEVGLQGVRGLLDSLSGLHRFAGAGGVPMSGAPLAPGDVVRDAVALIRPDRRSRERTFVVSVAEGLPVVHGDRSKLVQVLLNLARNAFDATVGRARVVLEVTATEARETVVFAVEDTGPGLPEAIANQLFEPFASTKGESGVGLGLFMARLLVNAHGGQLIHRVPQGGGTRFEVRLPAFAAT